MSYFRAFNEAGGVGKKNHCKWCGRKLRPKWRTAEAPWVRTWHEATKFDAPHQSNFGPSVKYGEPEYGDYRDGHFCGLRCGYDFALWFAEHGNVLKPKKESKS